MQFFLLHFNQDFKFERLFQKQETGFFKFLRERQGLNGLREQRKRRREGGRERQRKRLFSFYKRLGL
jgi:hypothetical protein